MTLASRRTIHVDEPIAARVDAIARAERALRQDVWDRAIARALDRAEPELVTSAAQQAGDMLRARKVSLPRAGMTARTIRQWIALPAVVPDGAVLVRDGDGWRWS